MEQHRLSIEKLDVAEKAATDVSAKFQSGKFVVAFLWEIYSNQIKLSVFCEIL